MNTIQELCREQWGSDAKVQNYGSFAVGSICTFSSDIDLALWGVVPTEEETHHNHFTFPRDPWKSDVDEYIADDVSTFTMDADDGSVDLDKEYEEKASSTDELDSSNNEPRKKTEVANSIVDLAAFDESSYPGDQTLFFIDTKPMGQTTGEAVVEAGEGSSLNQSGIDLIDCKGGSYRSGDAVNSTPSLAKGVKESCNNIVDEFEKTESHDARKEETNWQVLNDDGSDYNDDVEVSYFSKKSPVKLSAALSDEMRLKVNAVLKKIDRKCRKRRQFTQVTHIKSAKVPIMQSKTVFNFECDLSIGGHNGSDTNNLARHYTSAYNSFSVVTVFLKMLLRQADLDKPFTGGLGSYRLYVMIAFHIERHLRDGGADNPTELLLGFLHRYGLRKTDVVDNPFVACEQGGADLSGVYRIELCVELFHLTYEKLRSCLVTKNIEGRKEKISIVAQIVDSVRLHKEREGFIAKAKLLRFYETKKGGSPQSSGQKEPRKVVKSNEKKSGARKRTWAEDDDEAEAERLIRGYKMRRGPRGSLIPLQRPDLIHKKQQSPEEILLGRASKKRKNKKKQNRDKNLRHLARSEK
uniref:Poly(A) RNA polymerase mitochondrial-like central palm domain-containing protein n=1 Tax=Leptocylindrus danicus TaxID=163516 RepID=A0A7S2P2B0_9STRA